MSFEFSQIFTVEIASLCIFASSFLPKFYFKIPIFQLFLYLVNQKTIEDFKNRRISSTHLGFNMPDKVGRTVTLADAPSYTTLSLLAADLRRTTTVTLNSLKIDAFTLYANEL